MSHSLVASLSDTDATTVEHGLELGLTEDEYARACRILEGRVPNKVELGCFSAMWSEHCSYKSSRLHLGRLPSEGDDVVIGPGENAGVIDVGDGVGVCFKVESHNHPSFIEPYQGAATGVGGILRDVFTMGARPIAAANLFRFGRPEHPKTPHLLRGTVKGVGDYGNCFGVPTVWTDVRFDASYDGNILVNAFALGVVDLDRIFLGRAEGVGNPVFYVGAKTGRDGIHGATMASDSFSEEKEAERPTVQVGDPFKEKLLLEACLECFQTDALIGIQDMGAAGLTSSSFEMASRTGAGVRLDLDQIPRRETGMTAYELMLSESQERMLLVAKQGREQEVIDIFARWDLDAARVGEVTDDGNVRLVAGGQEVACLPARPLADEAPKYDRPRRARDSAVDPRLSSSAGGSIDELARAAMADPDLASRRFIYEQFDREVLVGTLEDGSSAAAAVVQLPSSNKGIALALVSGDHWCALDPAEGARRTVAEGALRVACTGAVPIGVSDCLNYGNPEVPEVMEELAVGVDGIAEACRALSTPVVSGNVSLYNQTVTGSGDGRAIRPTPTLAVVGRLDDAAQHAALRLTEGHELWRIGLAPVGLEGAWALKFRGPPPSASVLDEAPWPLDAVQALIADVLVPAIAAGEVVSARPVAPGGLLLGLAEMVAAGGVGATVQVHDDDVTLQLFAEHPAVIAAGPPAAAAALRARAAKDGRLRVEALGTVGGDELTFRWPAGQLALSVDEVRGLREGALPAIADRLGGNP